MVSLDLLKAFTLMLNLIRTGDKTAIIGKVFAVISKAFIYATVFLFMPLTPVGAFSRGGALFTGVLFNSLVGYFYDKTC